MPKKFLYFIALAVLVTVPMVVSYCSGNGDSGKSDQDKVETSLPEYPGWTKYTYKTFVYHFRRDASWRDKLHDIAQAFENAVKLDCEFFGKPAPEGPIHVYTYNTPDEAKTLLGKDVPYVTGNQIHWDRVANPYGSGIMMYLLEYWKMTEARYHFIPEGVVSLRDFSKRDFHSLTGMFQVQGTFVPLDELTDNIAYGEQERQIRSWEAASLVAFMTGTMGVEKFMEFWESGQEIGEFVQQNAGVPLPQFEQLWMKYTIDQYNKTNSNNQNR